LYLLNIIYSKAFFREIDIKSKKVLFNFIV